MSGVGSCFVSGREFYSRRYSNKIFGALAPVSFLFGQIGVAVGIFGGTLGQTCLYGILRDVCTMALEAGCVVGSRFGKADLPDFSQIAALVLQTIRETALDQLHGFFNCRICMDGQKQMDVIGHDDEIVDLEFARGHIGTENFDEEVCIAFGLHEAPAGMGFCGGKECARGAECVLLRRVADGSCHGRG